ncbi:MAG: hypothetical protein O3A59_12715 [Nitrospirae bacterium]|nr:hypothetical protein [Nitrospirota bacterium]
MSKMRIIQKLVIGMGIIVLVYGCAGSQNMEPPTWISHVPGGTDEVCVIGVSGPTFYSEDALARSKAQAMTELSRAMEVRVQAEMLVHERGDSRGSEASIIEEADFSSDVVLKRAQVKEQWVHPGGNERLGVRGMVYTLVCMPLQR